MINAVPYGSPAKIMYGISKVANGEGIETLTATGYSLHPSPETPENNIIISNLVNKSIHMALAYITGKEECFSYFSTKRFLNTIENFAPDIIHFHNMHCWYVNLPLLIDYINRRNCSVVWTLHDCWGITGHCTHFEYINCNKWIEGCHDCGQFNLYPKSMNDNSAEMFLLKQKWFTSIQNLTIVTPSIWLASYLKKSYLNNRRIMVINNGIDLGRYDIKDSNLKEMYGCKDKFVVLGVALGWSKKKGLDDFIKLAHELPNNYQIILVGTDKTISFKLPPNIICISKTENQDDLVKLYSMADVFVNPTVEDNFPTVNIEALACGTPVITYRTGGSPEIIDSTCGIVVDKEDFVELKKSILVTCEKTLFSSEDCQRRAHQFNMYDRFSDYVKLYRELLEK